MPVFAVLSQRFAVIRCDDDQGAVESAAFAQGRDQLSDQLVRPGDAAIIRTAGILRGVPAWRLVWCVEIVKMDPGEKVGPAFQPSNRFGRDRIARLAKR